MLPETIILINSDGTERTMTGDQFKAILNSRLRSVPQGEGSVNAKVVNLNPYTNEETGEETLIASYNLISPDMVDKIREHLQNGEYQDALNLALTSNFRPNSSRFIPSQGEIVKLSLGYVKNREDQEVLRVTGVSPLPKAATKSFSLDDLMGADAPPVSSEPSIVMTADAINAMDKAALFALAQSQGVDITSHLTGSGSAIKTAEVDVVRALLVEELV